MMAYRSCFRLDALARSAACSSRHARASMNCFTRTRFRACVRTTAPASSLDCSGTVIRRSNAPALHGATSWDARSAVPTTAAVAAASLLLVVAGLWGGCWPLLGGLGDVFSAARERLAESGWTAASRNAIAELLLVLWFSMG
uniref:Uncharacterized protein n=1 Tax=Arundo donax TaxID=35708 RepID=A0A0A8XRG2_ARUDO